MVTIDGVRDVILAERLWYLRQCNEKSVLAGQPLDLPFQTTLRTYAMRTGEYPSFEMLATITAEAASVMGFISKVRRDLESIAAVVRIADELNDETKLAAVSARCRALFDTIVQDDSSNTLMISNRYGFGLLPRSRLDIRRGSMFEIVDDVSCASIGLSMFYGFNLARVPGTYFLIQPSIRLLAATLELVAKKGFPECFTAAWWDREMVDELLSISSHRDLTQENYVALCEEFLTAHELGHAYETETGKNILDLFLQLGYSADELYGADFATEEDLRAWQRLEGGAGSVRDLTFVMGDLLANIAALKDGIPRDALSVLRAFNWWLLTPPAARQRAIGNAIFLRYGTVSRIDEVFSPLTSIVKSLTSNPNATSALMLAWEAESWRELETQRSYV